MPKLEDYMEGIINIFHQHSVLLGDPDSLSKNELKKLIMKELSNTIKNASDPATIEKLFQDLDENGDQKIDFKEFLVLLATVMKIAHHNMHNE